MMSLSTIHSLSLEAAQRAAARKEVPFLVEAEDIEDPRTITGIPMLGVHLPFGWRRVDVRAELHDGAEYVHGLYDGDADGAGAYLVDNSGFGSPGEPALTVGEFLGVLRPGYGYAVVEAGQFQVKVGVFKRIEG